ncbi:ribonucleotide-diphosphate reductase subunit beta [Amycolatopsis sp. NPDC059021]|uniref:ribonucleotide-diphosphate reductase subunit beta n=1 Tax=Amycolatopsis sp. NPDC059021 TaxID=3346704 RepID=UPI003672A28C
MTTAIDDELESVLTDQPASGTERGVGTHALYQRWENQHWAVGELDYDRDRAVWAKLRPFHRQELMRSLAEIEVGEASVTATLSSLIEHARFEGDQLYLATQIADEARHVKFFQTYLEQVIGIDVAAETPQLRAGTDYGHYFDPELRRVTKNVHLNSGDPVAWQAASTYYHLATEGILAATGLRTTRRLARTLGLPVLDAGLTNVTRDESRHISFGLLAARRAVSEGLGASLAATYTEAIELAALVLVGPRTKQPTPVIRVGLEQRAAQLRGVWSTARERVARQLHSIGLPAAVPAATDAFDRAIDRALDAYSGQWDLPHPVRSVPASDAE